MPDDRPCPRFTSLKGNSTPLYAPPDKPQTPTNAVLKDIDQSDQSIAEEEAAERTVKTHKFCR